MLVRGMHACVCEMVSSVLRSRGFLLDQEFDHRTSTEQRRTRQGQLETTDKQSLDQRGCDGGPFPMWCASTLRRLRGRETEPGTPGMRKGRGASCDFRSCSLYRCQSSSVLVVILQWWEVGVWPSDPGDLIGCLAYSLHTTKAPTRSNVWTMIVNAGETVMVPGLIRLELGNLRLR